MVINNYYSLNYTPLSAITKLHISVISLEVWSLLIFLKKAFAASLVPFLGPTVILLKQCLPSSNKPHLKSIVQNTTKNTTTGNSILK